MPQKRICVSLTIPKKRNYEDMSKFEWSIYKSYKYHVQNVNGWTKDINWEWLNQTTHKLCWCHISRFGCHYNKSQWSDELTIRVLKTVFVFWLRTKLSGNFDVHYSMHISNIKNRHVSEYKRNAFHTQTVPRTQYIFCCFQWSSI